MMLSCRETARLLSQEQDRSLAFGERVALRVHLAMCKGCRNVGRQFRFLRLAVQTLAHDASEDQPA
jgi:hypothetical protein